MKSAFLTQLFTDTSLTVAGLVIFFSFFLTVCGWVFLRKGARRHYDSMAQLPLRMDGGQHD